MDTPDEPETRDEHPGGKSHSATTRDDERYEVGDIIGRGGMGEVREAVDRQIGRRVAIKAIRTMEPSDRVVARFLREAQIQGRLEHPAIPAVHEIGRDRRGCPFFVMKKLAGTTLTQLLRRNPVPPRQRLLRAFVDVCLAVEFAHVQNVIHRDLKPDNIVLGEFGEVYVLDWGVAKVIGEDDRFADLAGGEHQTRAGAVLGTLGFMAPEQERGDADVDARADVYSLGVVLAEILDSDDDAAPELRLLVEQATAEKREDRLPSARGLADGVQRYLDGDRNLALRRELAREHLSRARAAFAQGDRSLAMREAGSALALDPQLSEAGELVGRLMLEPPTTTPPEVERELFAESLERVRANARGALWAFGAFTIFVPELLLRGHGFALFGAMLLGFGVVFVTLRRPSRFSAWFVALAFVPNIIILAVTFSPTLVAPGVAAVTASAISANPLLGARRASVVLWALLSASVIGPLIGENLGWLPRTLQPLPGEGVLLHTPILAADPYGATLHGGAFVLVLIAAAVVISHVMRRTDEGLRRRLHLQAWHLRQLVRT